MAASAPAAYGIYAQSAALNDVLHTLGQGGIEKESICMMLSPEHPIATRVREANTSTYERESNAATARLIAWLSEFGAVLIPKFGFFIRSQAFFHALIVEQSRSGCGSLSRLGFPDDEAERFESKVHDTGVMVYVSCAEGQKRWALELLRATGAQETGSLETESEAALQAAA